MSSINVLKVSVHTGSKDEESLITAVPCTLVYSGKVFTIYVCHRDLLDEINELEINCITTLVSI